MYAPKDWKNLERHELSADFPDITGDRWDEMVDDFGKYGNIDKTPIHLSADNKVVVGWQMLRLYKEHPDKGPPIFKRIKGNVTLETFVKIKEGHRRHLTHEELDGILAKQIERLRASGKSIRSIAAATGASRSEVQRQVSQLGTPDSQNSLDIQTNEDAESSKPDDTGPQTVVGADGKTYPARSRRSRREPQAIESGRVQFDRKKFDESFGRVVRMLDDLNATYGAPFKALMDELEEWLDDFLVGIKNLQTRRTG